MEFYEKLQQLRKQNNLTQEQLAEQLYVSRTAISKWETGKGYPNIESLKGISKLFSVSIDELLSSNELLDLAESENRSNVGKLFSFTYGMIDLLMIAFLFMPLFGQSDGTMIRSVSLLSYQDNTALLRTIFFAMFLVISLFGVVELIMQFLASEKLLQISKLVSVSLHALAILLFTAARIPYVTMLLFLLFMIKMLLLLRSSQIK